MRTRAAPTLCTCDESELDRIRRTWWMRLWSSKRLYECRGCGARLFVAKQSVERLHRPAPPIPPAPTPAP